MKILKSVALILFLTLGYLFWNHQEQGKTITEFIPTVMPSQARPDTVIILAPVNCPSDAARRADDLAEELKQMGIPVIRSNRFDYHFTNPTEEEKADLKRATAVLKGKIPAVFVNGMGRSNPTAEEVAEEYRKPR